MFDDSNITVNVSISSDDITFHMIGVLNTSNITSFEDIHRQCHCYVSFSHSEGVGMGAVEAALHDKPVIITEYGGAKEYVKTPYTIDCDRCLIGVDDFLYTKDMEWGDPKIEQLSEFMKNAYDKKLSYMNHDYTRNLLVNVKKQFKIFTDDKDGRQN